YAQGYSEGTEQKVLEEYCRRLSEAAKMAIATVPVRKAPHQRPIYELVFATRNARGYWHFSDVMAKSVEEWWSAQDERNVETAQGQLALMPEAPRLADVEAEAISGIKQNILGILKDVTQFIVGDRPITVLGDYYGSVREATVRKAIKQLHR